MTADRLTELLEDSSAEVAPPSFAATAWATARRVRRRRQVLASVAAFAAVVAVTVPLRDRGGDDIVPAPPAQSAPASAAPAGVDVMPAKPVQRALPGLPVNFAIPADAAKLSQHPVEQAVAVVQDHAGESADQSMRPLHVIDAAGRWTRVDVGDLVRTHDEGGNQAEPLRSTALSPDGRRIAVPQPEALVVIDLPAAKAHRIPLPGLNEQVMWWGDETVFVGQESTGVTRVDWASGVVSPEPAAMSAWIGGGSPVAAADIADLITAGEDRRVRVWRPGDATPVREVPVDFVTVRPEGYAVSEWYGAAMPDGAGRVAAAAWGDRVPPGGPGNYGGVQMLTVVDTTTGRVDRLLDLGTTRSKSCCEVLGWIDDQTLLAHTDLEGLITWNTRTGEITRVTTGPVAATVSVRPR
ncbi:hypothetical protein [Actinoplanes xinjiangensis]|uniref:WD40 repeat protein n=1 Tax=Actinoplanes xinjiangensis TaxID=512350 RepID=A0A316EKE7_9ACTN|nr:hypothetical protein [Actinoplanes xinjiangensis]PWK30496.1 hypothetical protein BC793_13857 [Actinoplanes xinjiangensis]GIF44472.1 hypothetical protein Axi01nite_87830 [Actinoplanes xinjiangensis]